MNAKQRKYYAEHREEMRAYARMRYVTHIETKRASDRAYRERKKHALSAEDLKRLMAGPAPVVKPAKSTKKPTTKSKSITTKSKKSKGVK